MQIHSTTSRVTTDMTAHKSTPRIRGFVPTLLIAPSESPQPIKNSVTLNAFLATMPQKAIGGKLPDDEFYYTEET